MNVQRLALKGVIVACILMFIYTMIYYPYRCNEITMFTGGVISCGLNVGAYLLAIVMCVVATVAAIILID